MTTATLDPAGAWKLLQLLSQPDEPPKHMQPLDRPAGSLDDVEEDVARAGDLLAWLQDRHTQLLGAFQEAFPTATPEPQLGPVVHRRRGTMNGQPVCMCGRLGCVVLTEWAAIQAREAARCRVCGAYPEQRHRDTRTGRYAPAGAHDGPVGGGSR